MRNHQQERENTMSLVRLIVLVSIGMIGLVLRTNAAEPVLTQKPLYIAGLDGVNIYRIPSLITTQEGTVLAFCEAREAGDKSPTDLVLKRSFDNGRTWQAMQTLCTGEGGAIMNPTPVVDRSDGTVLLACNLVNRAKGLDRTWILKSADDGASWSKPVDITKSVGPVHPGPGRGILLKSGRLVIPGRSADKHGQSLVIYSNDHGKTWNIGAGVAPNTTESQVIELADGRIMINMRSTRRKGCRSLPVHIDHKIKNPEWHSMWASPGAGTQLRGGRLVVPFSIWQKDRHLACLVYSDDHGKAWQTSQPIGQYINEPKLVELGDGTWLLNARTRNSKGKRAVCRSMDQGLTWTPLQYDDNLIEPSCQASLIRYVDDANGRQPEMLLFSNPASTQRKKLTVRASYDGGKNWPVSRVIHSGPAAYSSLTVLPDGSIGMLYERGEENPYERITFARFTLKWLDE